MQYVTKGIDNTLTLNINQNSRDTFTNYKFVFTHSLSQYSNEYILTLDTENDRFCTVILPLSTDDLEYYGQYELTIYGDSTDLVFTGFVKVIGEDEEIIPYVSDNEDNNNYIYIE